MITFKSHKGKQMSFKQLVSLFAALLFITNFAFAEETKVENCNYKFQTEKNKIVLPEGYYQEYIKSNSSQNLKYHNVMLKTENIDHGYVYCLAQNTEKGPVCIDDVDKIIDTDKIMFLTIHKKSNTYFFFKHQNEEVDLVLPLSKEYMNGSNLQLSLLKYFEGKPEVICNNPANNLNIALKPFEVGYKVSENIEVDSNQKTSIKVDVALEVKDTDGVDIIVSDIYGKTNKVLKDPTSTHSLTVTKDNKAGFCISYKSHSDDETLKKGKDYFCKTFSFDKENETTLDSYWKGDLSNKKYIQVGKSNSTNAIPHIIVGAKKSSELLKKGYILKSVNGKKGSYIVVGPFKETELKQNLDIIQKIEKTAAVY